MEWTTLSNFAITLFALLNPLGMLPIFISFTTGERKGTKRWLALFISLTVLALLLIFLITGATILNFFGVTINSFRIAGGILLLIMGLNIVSGKFSNDTDSIEANKKVSAFLEAESVYSQIVIPMAMPLLVGPGAIANVILHASEAQANGGHVALLGLALAILVVSLIVFIIFFYGQLVQRLLGNTGLSIIQRTIGLFVAAIGVQFIVTGTENIIILNIAPEIIKSM